MGIVKAQRLRIVRRLTSWTSAESPLGIYLINGWIDEAQFYAGREYARIVAAAKRDDDSPPEDPQNRVLANLLPSDARGVPVEHLYSPEELRAKREERRRRYARVFGLLKQEGLWVMDAVNTVALRERGSLRRADGQAAAGPGETGRALPSVEGGLTCARKSAQHPSAIP
jgi:hypothetical protein